MADLAVDIEGVDSILRRYAGLSKGVQKKYLSSSVREVVKAKIPEVKALTPKGPTGNLRRSVGLKIERKRRGVTIVGLIGYRQKVGGNRNEQGFHSWWIENGVKMRSSANGRALKVPIERAKKYPYLKGKVALIGGDGAGSVFFRSVRGFGGVGKFEQWSDANLPKLKNSLVGKLENNVGKAISEQERRDIRRAARRR